MSVHHLADAGRSLAFGVTLHHGQRRVGNVRGNHGNEDPFVGHIQWVQPQELTGTFHGLTDRQIPFLQADPRSGFLADLIQHGGHASPGRITEESDLVTESIQQADDEVIDGLGVAEDGAFEGEPFPNGEDGHAMGRDRTAHQDLVA